MFLLRSLGLFSPICCLRPSICFSLNPACVCLTFSRPHSEYIAVRIVEHGGHAFCERLSVALCIAVSFGCGVDFSLTLWLGHAAVVRHGKSGEPTGHAVE